MNCELEGAGDAGSIDIAGAHSIDTICRSPVQGTIMEECRERMMESLDRANRVKCETNLIDVARSEMGPLARMIGSND